MIPYDISRFSPKDVESDNRAPFDVVKGYKLLLSASRDESVLDSSEFRARCQELYDRLKAFGPAFSYANALEDERTILYENLAEHERQIASLKQIVAKRDGQIDSLKQVVAKRDGQIASIKRAVVERDMQVASLNQAVAERDEQLNSIKRAVAERDGQVASLNQALHHARLELEKILLSNSWRITKPLRFVRRMAVSQPYVVARRAVSNWGRALWHSLPLSFSTKRKFKDALFSSFPWVFCWTKAYRAWAGFNLPQNVDSLKHGISPLPQANTNEYVPLFNGKPLREKPVKLICFYLPQFHPIPENNAWWGDGFTEWTNVKLATPQFEGHYQPRVPGELGYYNLLDPDVVRRQVKLAELYGIEGFCFYFYWFNGKRLLEKPILNYLNDSQIHFPFCLCWANENWSRRWDGLDSEILIAQKHSPEDDFSFIEYIARYLRDPSYIRINGKPLLIVYRPSLLPSAKKTAHRWRTWCRTEGIGEIYLAYTQSFEMVAPAIYGFDAAIEFPPNNSFPPDISDCVKPLRENFGNTIYDWRVFVERSEKYKPVSYTLFRGVCPSWDNTARRKNDGTVFLNNSPMLYQRWLKNAIADVVEHNPNPDERLIFVNAWNEWAEGAYLEPDARYGYAWLQATRNAISGEAYNPTTNGRSS